MDYAYFCAAATIVGMSIADMNEMTPKMFLKTLQRISQLKGADTNKRKATVEDMQRFIR